MSEKTLDTRTPTEKIDAIMAAHRANDSQEQNNSEPDNNTNNEEDPSPKPDTPAQEGPDVFEQPTRETGEVTEVAKSDDDDGNDTHQHHKGNDTKTENTSSEDNSKYKEFYEEVTAPLKASGKQRVFTRPDEIRGLMSKGVDYSLKMGDMKRHRATAELVLSAGINDKELRTLIDVFKGEHEAIKYYAKKANLDFTDIDPLDDTEPTSYSPKTEARTDKQIVFEDTLANVRQSYPAVYSFLNILGEQDVAKLVETPAIMDALGDHADKGFFSKVFDEMERRYITGTLGQEQGLLVAYNKVFNDLINTGAFDDNQESSKKAATVTPPQAPSYHTKQRAAVGKARQSAPSRRSQSSKKSMTVYDIAEITDPAERTKALNAFIEKNK